MICYWWLTVTNNNNINNNNNNNNKNNNNNNSINFNTNDIITIVLGGKAEPSAEDVTSLITSAGGEVDEEQLGVLLADVAGKNLNELLAKGEEDLKSVSVGGGGSAAPVAATGNAPAPAAAPAKPKEEEVDALDGG